jgi:hypothetical protein
MNLKTYKKLHKKYSEFPLRKEVWDTPEHQAYADAFHNNKDCQLWELKQRVKKAGINYKNYCCIDMAYQLIAFGLPIHDGGSSFIKINFCPWCGKKLT